MNVKKLMLKMVVAVATGAAFHMAAFAETSSDVLMWYLDIGDSPDVGIQGQSFDSINFYLRSLDGESSIGLNKFTYTSPDKVGGAGMAGGISGTYAGTYYTDLSGAGNINWSNYEFMMLLYSGGDLVGFSESLFHPINEPVTYSTLQSAHALYARTGSSDLAPSAQGTGATAYNFGQHVVPEPTSGLLMLVGGALLALRRKREQA